MERSTSETPGFHSQAQSNLGYPRKDCYRILVRSYLAKLLLTVRQTSGLTCGCGICARRITFPNTQSSMNANWKHWRNRGDHRRVALVVVFDIDETSGVIGSELTIPNRNRDFRPELAFPE
jgi:hypothetical protein